MSVRTGDHLQNNQRPFNTVVPGTSSSFSFFVIKQSEKKRKKKGYSTLVSSKRDLTPLLCRSGVPVLMLYMYSYIYNQGPGSNRGFVSEVVPLSIDCYNTLFL